MRILQVVPTYYPAVRYGGPIRSVHGLARALRNRGHEVQVFTTSVDGPNDLDIPVGDVIDVDGVGVTYFAVPALRRLYYSPQMRRRLEQVIDTFDVVHLHSVYLWPTWMAARIAARACVPYMVSPRGMLIKELIRRKNRWIKTAWINLIERRTFTAAAGIHVTAPVEEEELRGLDLHVAHTYCIGNGVEVPSQFVDLSAGPFANVEQPYALFLSRLSWKKGIERLIDAWTSVHGLHLAIAGNEEDVGYRERLERRVRDAGLSGRVSFTGAVSDEHKWALYRHAQMFVFPSYSENFGNVVAEAMAMACPVIITPEVGLAPFVHQSGSGIVTSGEPAALASAVKSLQSDSQLREGMGQAGRAAVLRGLAWPAIAEQMEEAYGQMRDRTLSAKPTLLPFASPASDQARSDVC